MSDHDVGRTSSRRFWFVLVLIGALFVAQGLYYARTLVPVHDGVQYLLIGAKVLRGELSIFDDRLTGNRLPLPFYVLGMTQLAGPNLLAARWLNVGFGVLILVLTALLARRLAGTTAGILAALFLATQGVVVAYYSYESYPAFAALCLMLCLVVLMGGDSTAHRLGGTALVGLLFLVRSNLWPVVPCLLAYALWRARSLAERAALVGAVVVPPLIFLAWDPSHLKVLAYVPLLRRLVAPLGYVSVFIIDARETLRPAAQLWEVARLARRYEFWVLAGALLALVTAWRAARGHRADWTRGTAGALAVIFLCSLGALFTMYSWNFRWIGLYFLPYAPVVALLLGIGYAELVTSARRRWIVGALLIGLLVPPLYFVRNPLLPIGEARAADPFGADHRAAARLRTMVPSDARVFFYGLNVIYYLAQLPQTYVQQVYIPNQFARMPMDDEVLRRSGIVTAAEMRYWLSHDADYVVIDTTFLEGELPHFGETEKEMMVLIERHFEVVGRVTDAPGGVHTVYKRRGR
ncbi:MAG: hypothetical protein DME04_18045 [Candidatus Rokuibacteriota bacterium]|nr:MAG: hypothetical protein DME04_18045 [Candidatus Rokubacteria bacterium]